MKQRLFVIEAPGKQGAFANLADKAFPDSRNKVVATRGRLVDLDTSASTDSLSEIVSYDDVPLLPLNPSHSNYLRERISIADEVLICTDPDTEGEWIAATVQQLAPGSSLMRMRVATLTTGGLLAAYGERCAVNPALQGPALNRRLFDRISADLTHVKDRPYSGGRISSPLAALSLARREVGCIRKPINNDGWLVEVPLYADDSDVNHELALQALGPQLSIDVDEHAATLVATPILPYTYQELLLTASRILKKPVQQVAEDIQELYEEGKVSYPRSDSRTFSPQSIATLSKLAVSTGRTVINPAHGDNALQQAHEPIHPLSLPENYAVQTDKDKILSLLSERAFDALTGATLCTYTLSPEDKGPMALQARIAEELRRPAKIIKRTIRSRPNSTFERPATRSHTVALSQRGVSHDGTVSTHADNAEQHCLALMIENDIGRPSTAPKHAVRYGKLLFQPKSLGPSAYAREIHEVTLERFPGLLIPEVCKQITSELTNITSLAPSQLVNQQLRRCEQDSFSPSSFN
ncbi:DNA topoisomerase [Ferrimonas marina]|uniref:DNA topoisomerase IA n=1 Tax=Ferrimonas marina TaxID=299255 RepID=A0A1M5THN1_9GAMM|nr:DNA topoisomerase [Ferrimonas marina]SHH50257.1 DNA topoisomerase IA [Ferrimonas marina]